MDVSVSAARAVTPLVWQAIHPVSIQKDRAFARFFLITLSCLLVPKPGIKPQIYALLRSVLTESHWASAPFPCGDAFNYLLRKYYRRHFTG